MSAKPPKGSHRKSPFVGPEGPNVLRRGASRLIEQGRLMWLLGEGLSAVLNAQDQGWAPRDEESLVADLYGWTQKVLSGCPEGLGIGRTSPQSPVPSSRVRPAIPRSVTLMRGSLADLNCPVLWVGSSEIGGQWVSMALAAGVDGLRRVLALTPGSVREQVVAEGLLADLAARGLEASGLLVITEGSRTLDRAIASVWDGRVKVSHCHARLRSEVIGHFPEGSRKICRRELDAAWSLPVIQSAALLQDLEVRWAIECPGAAERLARSREASLIVARLGVSSPLKEQLESAGTLRMAFKKAWGWAPSGPTLSSLIVGVPAWLQRVRRLVGWRGLELLARTLRNHTTEPNNIAAP